LIIGILGFLKSGRKVLLNEWVVEGVDSDPHDFSLDEREREIKSDSRMNHDNTYVMIQGVLCANVPID
jgi:hypothetical protein